MCRRPTWTRWPGGTLFTDAYTTSPICVPARAAFAVGKYVHQIGFWDNADPYDGSQQSWHHLLRERGHDVVSIGKLHFRSSDDDNGFTEEILPMHVIEGKGDLGGSDDLDDLFEDRDEVSPLRLQTGRL